MRYLLLFWLGLTPLLFTDLLLGQHGEARGATLALVGTLALGALVGVLTRLLWLPLLRRIWSARGARRPPADAEALGAGLAWSAACIALVRGSQTVVQYLLSHPGLSFTACVLAVTLGLLAAARLLAPLRLPATPQVAAAFLLAAAMLTAFGEWRDRGIRSARKTVAEPIVAGAPAPRQPNVVLVVLDTTRSGALGGRFEDQIPMPWFEEFAASGRRWERAYSGANSTPPGHTTLLTGLYPAEAGMLSKGHLTLPQEQLTLAEVLASHGWRNAAVVSNRRVSSDFGFQQGFEVYDDTLVRDKFATLVARRIGFSALPIALAGRYGLRLGDILDEFVRDRVSETVTAAQTTRQVAQVLDEMELQPEEPLFLFVNYIDPHLLYITRPDLATAFGPNLDDAELERTRTQSLRFHLQLQALGERIRGGEDSAVLATKLRWVREAYWEQCRELDEGLRGMFEDLERRGRLGPGDVVLITSDHGEELGEHAEFLHGSAMFEASIRVPYWLRAPGVAPGVEGAVPVSGVDFFPTVLEATGLPREQWPADLAGVPLQHPVPAGRMVRFESGRLRGFLQGDRKLIALDDGHAFHWLHAFDLGADPEERRDLLGPGAPEWVKAYTMAPPMTPSDSAVEVVEGGANAPDLRALGYADEAAGEQ